MRTLLSLLIIAALLAGCGQFAGTPTPTAIRPTIPPTRPPTAAATATTTQAPTTSATATAAFTSTVAASPTLTAAVTLPPTPTNTSQPTASLAPFETAAPSITPAAVNPVAPVTGSTPAVPGGASGPGIAGLEHIILIMFENRNYSEVIGRQDLTNFNHLAQENVLFTHYYAIAHPSLPNYLALTGGSTFGIKSDCMACFVDAPNLADRLEAGGKTWKSYQEGMPSACSLTNTNAYDLNHNPWLYYNSIREDAERCGQSVVPLSQLDEDLRNNQLPNFAQIMPDLCNSAHNCNLSQADQWLGKMINQLQSSPALGQNYAIFVTFDEASSTNSSCCGVPTPAGGRIATILISPLAKPAFQDDTPVNHYSLLKTILQAWALPGLGATENPETPLIAAPWK